MQPPAETHTNNRNTEKHIDLFAAFLEDQKRPSTLNIGHVFKSTKINSPTTNNSPQHVKNTPFIPLYPLPMVSENKLEKTDKTRAPPSKVIKDDSIKRIERQQQIVVNYKQYLNNVLLKNQLDLLTQNKSRYHPKDEGKNRVSSQSLQNARQMMRAWLAKHWMNPYLTLEEINGFANRFGMTPMQVKRFFTNERKRFLLRKGCKKNMNINTQLNKITSNLATNEVH